MRLLIPTIICLFFAMSSLFAQAQGTHNHKEGTCALQKAMQDLHGKQPELKNLSKDIENTMMLEMDSIISKLKQSKVQPEEMVVPVVFHLFYDECEEPEDVRDNDRFQNAIDKLNADFSGVTAGCATSDDCNLPGASLIRFALAEKDTLGNPTTGVNRIKSGLTNQGLANSKELKYKIMWPRDKYLNIYVVKKATLDDNSGLAHYPSTSHYELDKHYDGITMAYWAINPLTTVNSVSPDSARENYDYILTHEVGHWLGLRHIWGDLNSNKKCSNCDTDDFNFIDGFMEEFQEFIDPNNILTDWEVFDDTPNTIGRSIKDSICGPINTCPDNLYGPGYEIGIAETTIPSSGTNLCDTVTTSPIGSLADLYDNFMDYTSCAQTFTEGQINFMELVLKSNIAKRKNLISEENQQAVFYSESDITKRVIFKDFICHENLDNSGYIEEELEFKLSGLKFNSSLIGPNPLPGDYYSIDLPTNLSNGIYISSDTTAKLRITNIGGIALALNEDFKISFTLGNNLNPFSDNETLSNIPVENRSKELMVDMIEEQGIVYGDLKANAEVGPNSVLWKPVYVNYLDMSSTLYLLYEDSTSRYMMENAESPNMQFYVDNSNVIKTYTKGATVNNGNYYDSSLFTDPAERFQIQTTNLPLDENGDFYIAFRLNFCNENYFYGWMRLRYDNECQSLIAIDYGIDSYGNSLLTGDISNPILLYYPKKITIKNLDDNNNKTFTGFEINLLQTSSNQAINNSIEDTTNCIITNIEPSNIPLTSQDLIIERIDATTAYVNANPTSSFWDNNENSDFTFKLHFTPTIFSSGLNPILQYASDSTIQVYQPEVEPLQIQSSNSIAEPVLEDYGSISFPFDGANIVSYLNFVYYQDELDPTSSGYIFFADYGFHYEALCLPNSNELALLDYGTPIPNNSNNFKLVGAGSLTPTDGLPTTEVYLPEQAIERVSGQEKYILYRFIFNCETYNAWMKVSINEGGSISLLQTVYNSVESQFINAGFLPNQCIPSVIRSSDIYIEQFSVPDIGYENNQINAPNTGESAYTDYTSHPTIVLDLAAQPSYLFEISQETNPNTSTGEPNKGNWYIWVDYNQNGLFSSDELVMQVSESAYASEFISFPSSLAGTYKMRIITSLHPLNGFDGCQDFAYGETEEYLIEFINDCPNDLLFTEAIPSGERHVNNSITMNTNAYFSAGKNATLVAENYIEILPNTLIEKYSIFEARIENCESTWITFPNYPWLENIVNDSDCCDVMNVSEYISPSGTPYILVENDLSCNEPDDKSLGILYYSDGGTACNYQEGYDCINLFTLSYVQELWSCNTSAKTTNKPQIEKNQVMELSILPNPFNNLFEVHYQLSQTESVTIELFSLDGKKLKTILDGQIQEAGQYTKSVDANNLQSGIYLLHISTSQNREVRKVIKM